jgi:hypothetical protein
MSATALASVRQLVDQRLSEWMSTLELSSIRASFPSYVTHRAGLCPRDVMMDVSGWMLS